MVLAEKGANLTSISDSNWIIQSTHFWLHTQQYIAIKNGVCDRFVCLNTRLNFLFFKLASRHWLGFASRPWLRGASFLLSAWTLHNGLLFDHPASVDHGKKWSRRGSTNIFRKNRLSISFHYHDGHRHC